ncbi:hypothetical protein HMPREF3167_04800 [Trueperella sp. HMSC08B05]|nr:MULTISPECIES: cellulose synthase operon protein YhjQ/BcsQ [Trueperella]MDV6239666.1 cellulose synthase operon protein YhjQ/BcsQ [Trueperella bernardiae]OFS66201.1 hypothetical protein HMPREF3174_06315 [Trueperella sp. HMSC08H06]OFS74728.1 hypothetical protein HMPREF3167_04800 [Trueperella sp. HMSC08B05]
MENMHSVVYTGTDRTVGDELARLADLVGIDFARLRAPAVLMFDDADAPGQVEAHFHEMFAPYFPRGRVRLDPHESADVLELMAAVGLTMRGRVIGVVGAHGGAGASTIAAWLARLIAVEDDCALVDVNPASVGIDHLLAIDAEPGKRWADLAGDGAILAGRLNRVLPRWQDVRVVSADDRGGVPDAAAATRVISALAQTHAWTVLDLPVAAGMAGSEWHGLLDWCDVVLLVTRPDAVALAHARARRDHIGRQMVAVGNTVGSKMEAAHLAGAIGVPAMFSVRTLRGTRGDLDHGVTPGDRKRSGAERDLRALWEHVLEVTA